MSDEIIVSVIALGGVVLSVVASLYISMRQTTSELRKVRTEIQQTYTDKLLEKRIEVYPELYKVLSMFTKSIVTTETVSMINLKELHSNISVWDVNNAIFLSGKAFELHYRFRKLVDELVKESVSEFEKKDLLSDLRNKADSVKLALKEDLGIFVVEFSDEDDIDYKSFKDVANATVGNEKK